EEALHQRIANEPIDHAVPVAAWTARRGDASERALERAQARGARELFRPADAQRVGSADIEVACLHDAQQPPLDAAWRVWRQRLEAHARLCELADELRID